MSDVDNIKLARLLRECATFVERNEFNPSMYQIATDLQTYAAKLQNTANTKGREISKPSSFGAGLSGITKTLGKIGLVEKEKGKVTSTKNAERAKTDLQDLKSESGSNDDDNWSARWTSSGGGSSVSAIGVAARPARPGKPAFQRPANLESTLVASGWIEQQRRSKLRIVWKDILASLVEGRKPKEETTLWIQRECTNAVTGKRELEALHQIPIKWLQEVQYLDFYGDYRFSLRVYNVTDEFVFRCPDQESAQNWVLTLRSVKDENFKKQQQPPAEGVKPVANSTPMAAAVTASSTTGAIATPALSKTVPFDEYDTPERAEQPVSRMSVKEMRSIAHGAGINTHGMERTDLELVVAKVLGTGGISSATNTTADALSDAVRRQEELERLEQMRRNTEKEHDAAEEEKRRKLEELQAQRVAEALKKAREEEERAQVSLLEEQRRQAAVAEERRRVEEQRRLAEEERRRVEEQRRLAEEQRRQAAIAEEQRRRLSEQEQLRRQEEERQRAQQQYQQQQQQWQAQQAAQQQWQAQQAAAAQQRAQAAQQAQWQQWQQQQQQQQHAFPQQQQQAQQQRPFGNAPPQQPGQRPSEPPTSNADMKYTKMAQESNGGEAVTINVVKRSILTHWALQPPTLQHLRSIADLLISIHTVFPPAFGVPGHEHFKKWTPVTREELIPVGAGPDEEKLKKAVKKLRFFLHPDKLPRDLNDEQQFMCKMLWDISSDAWEEFKKRHEELDWMQK